jgi:DNA-directed RNA polymerase subunit RPC12/RpoP
MRYRCYFCGKSVTTELPSDAVIRAILVCPECIEAGRITVSARKYEARETTRFVSLSRYEMLFRDTKAGEFSLPDADGKVRSHYDIWTDETTEWYVVPDDDPRAETYNVHDLS